MKTTYLKTVNRFGGKITGVIALTETNEITVSNENISFEDLYLGKEWYIKELKAVDSNKEEFDAFYIEQVGILNDLIKEL
jgi:hypothetical protein